MFEIATSTKRVHVNGDDEGVSEPGQLNIETGQLESNDGNGTEKGTDHPLDNHLVLGIIFDHLPQKYWKRARLVNKTWHSALQPIWRDQMLYKFGLATDYPLLGNGTKAIWNTPRFQFLEQQHPTNNPNDPLLLSRHPIQNISVGWCWNDNYIPLIPDQNQFWEVYGHGLKYINLDRVFITQGALLKRLLFELTPCLEEFIYWQCVCNDMDKKDLNTVTSYTPPAILRRNLKCFNVCTVNGHQETKYGEYKRRFPISWMEFFSVFPNMQKLTVDVDRGSKPSIMLKLFKAIDIIRKANNNEVLNIIQIDTPNKVGFSRFNVIKNKSLIAPLPISSLRMNVIRMSNEEIICLVSTFKSTLRDLILQHIERSEPYLPLDMLPQGLIKLRLLGRFFPSFEFLSCTPNLEVLKFQEEVDIGFMFRPEVCAKVAATPLVNLKKLMYTKEWGIREGIDILSKMMPNVTKCVCTIDTEGFRLMCQRWTNLEHLDLKFAFLSEESFLENLVQLKRLKSLKINWYEVSDESVYDGLLKMPFLSKLVLPTKVLINEEPLVALEAKMCVDFVYFHLD